MQNEAPRCSCKKRFRNAVQNVFDPAEFGSFSVLKEYFEHAGHAGCGKITMKWKIVDEFNKYEQLKSTKGFIAYRGRDELMHGKQQVIRGVGVIIVTDVHLREK